VHVDESTIGLGVIDALLQRRRRISTHGVNLRVGVNE
jgi:hypothetical protein